MAEPFIDTDRFSLFAMNKMNTVHFVFCTTFIFPFRFLGNLRQFHSDQTCHIYSMYPVSQPLSHSLKSYPLLFRNFLFFSELNSIRVTGNTKPMKWFMCVCVCVVWRERKLVLLYFFFTIFDCCSISYCSWSSQFGLVARSAIHIWRLKCRIDFRENN